MILDPSQDRGRLEREVRDPQAAPGPAARCFHSGVLGQPGPDRRPGDPDPRDPGHPGGRERSKSGSTTAGPSAGPGGVGGRRDRSAPRCASTTRPITPPRASGWTAPTLRGARRSSPPSAAGGGPSARWSSTATGRPTRDRPGRRRVPRVHARAGAAALGRDRERPAARGHPAAAAPARGHVQLARRSRRRHGQASCGSSRPTKRSRRASGLTRQDVIGQPLKRPRRRRHARLRRVAPNRRMPHRPVQRRVRRRGARRERSC